MQWMKMEDSGSEVVSSVPCLALGCIKEEGRAVESIAYYHKHNHLLKFKPSLDTLLLSYCE